MWVCTPVGQYFLPLIQHHHISDQDVHRLIRKQEILFGGNKKLKIYGTISCSSGKRMKKENRVFFKDKAEALQAGYRPCGHCMKLHDSKFEGLDPGNP
jgi:methylphosphotriester-DNA--protein-cysteine methyltransferase